MTTWWSWQVRRATASRSLLVVLLLVVITTSAIIAGALGYSSAAATSAARSALAGSTRSAVVVSIRLGDDASRQDRSARAALLEGFAPARVDIISSIVSEPRDAILDGTALAPRVVAIGGEWLTTGEAPPPFHLVEGHWAARGTLDGALEVRTAAEAGAGIGSVLVVEGRSIRVTGLWQDRTPEDDAKGDRPSLVVDTGVINGLGSTPFLRWDVAPDVGRITEDQLPALAAGAGRVRDLVRTADTTGRGVTVEGDLAPVAAAAAQESATARAVQVVPLAVLLLACTICAAQVSRLLVAARGTQEQLLAARGAGPARLAAMDLLEGLAVAAAGSAAGGLLAAAGLALVPGGSHQFSAVATGALLTLALMSCLMLVSAVSQYRRNPVLTVVGAGSRVRTATGIGAVALVGLAAALSAWRLLSRDAVVTGVTDTITPDVVSAAAPALLLATSAIVALLLLAPLTRIAARLTRRMPSAVWPLAAAHVSRSLLINAVTVVLAVMASGTATLTAVAVGSLSHHQQELRALDRGADLRISTDAATATKFPLVAVDPGGVPGVAAASPVWLDPSAALGDATITTVALPADRLEGVTLTPRELLPPSGMLGLAPSTGPAPVALPGGAQVLTVDVTATVSLDPWQQATLQIQPEFARRQTGDVSMAGPALEAYRTPIDVDVSVRLRDAATGEGGLVAATTVQLPGPDVSWTSDYSTVTSAPTTRSIRVNIPLDLGRDLVLDGVEITSSSAEHTQARTLDVSVRARAAGQDLFGNTTADWGGDDAVTMALAGPYLDDLGAAGAAEVRIEQDATSDYLGIGSNKPFMPLLADLTGDTWRIRDTAGLLDALVLGPGIPFVGQDPLRAMAAVRSPTPPRVPVAITDDAATDSALAVGDQIEIITHQRFVPAVVVAVVGAVPGTTSAAAVVMDSRALGAVLGWRHDDVPSPQEVWVAVDGDADAVTNAVLALPGAGSVVRPREGAGQGASRALRLGLLVAAAGTLVQAIVGISAAAAMQWTARRHEVTTLRALGFSPAAQGASRAAETLVVLGSSIALGTLAGTATATLSVSALLHSVFHGQVRLPVRTVWDPVVTAVLGALLTAVVAGMAFLTRRVVARQALAADRREDLP